MQTFASFRHRNYRLFFSGQLVSVIGSWMQQVAMGWLVYDLSKSTLTLGAVRFASALPVTLLTLLGGAMADRVSKRRVVILSESAAMLLAFALAALVYFGVIEIWHIVLIGFLEGITDAFDIPTRQSFIVEIVGKEDLMNALALNSSLFNGARVIGPALAGVLIAAVGMTGCFLANGLSYLAVVGAYLAMRLPVTPVRIERSSLWKETLEALRYLRDQSLLRMVITQITIVSLFGSYQVLLPVFAKDILQTDASGFGYLLAANGLGAFLGAITLASAGNSPHRRKFLFGGLLGWHSLMIAFACSPVYWLSALILVAAGFCMIMFFATANTTVQSQVPDSLRGRVMGIYSFAFIGLSPFGGLLAGWMAEVTNAPVTVILGASICMTAGLIGNQVRQSPWEQFK